ncbi:hypothetical protein VCHC80A1_01492, partial [Vibrio cholerae HC-80A1]
LFHTHNFSTLASVRYAILRVSFILSIAFFCESIC